MGYKVKEARTAANMTQEELERKSGISRATISSLENGTTRGVSSKTLLCLARALGVRVEDIFYTDS